MSDKEDLTKNIAFLQAVICMFAEERYQEEIIETESTGEIGPGQQWESKEDWMSDIISEWFNDAGEKAKLFTPGDGDLKVKKRSINFAKAISKAIYNLPLGEQFRLNDDGVGYIITRVPGGWIYIIEVEGVATTVFVPWNNEFQKLASLEASDILHLED